MIENKPKEDTSDKGVVNVPYQWANKWVSPHWRTRNGRKEYVRGHYIRVRQNKWKN